MQKKEDYSMDAWVESIAEAVYERLLDQYREGTILPDVIPVFVPGHPCYEAYIRMQEASERIRHRLGAEGEDPDLEIVIDALLQHGRILAMEMFRYGVIYGAERNR